MTWRPDSVDRNKYMTRSEAAVFLGITKPRIKPLVDSGQLAGVQRGKFLYIDRASARAYLAKHPRK